MSENFFTPHTARHHIGETFRSGWITIDQVRINVFGAVTEDPDPHHIDPKFCETHSPWGKPISFGFLTLSLVTPLLYQVYRYDLDADPETYGYPASYGTDFLRMVAPVPVGSRIRAAVTPKEVLERKPGQRRITLHIEIEIEGSDRPAIVTDWHMIWFLPASQSSAPLG
jgi:acyl dehydratase